MSQMVLATSSFPAWVRAPLRQAVERKVGLAESTPLVSGAVRMYHSPMKRTALDLSFNGTENTLQALNEVLTGRAGYTRGDYQTYFVQLPHMEDINLLPDHWAMPGKSAGLRGMFAKTTALPNRSLVVPPPGITTSVRNPQFIPGQPEAGMRLWTSPWLGNYSGVGPDVSVHGIPRAVVIIPPTFQARLSVWGVRNNALSPQVGYTLMSSTGTSLGNGMVNPTTANLNSSPLGSVAISALAGVWRFMTVYLKQPAGSHTYSDEHYADFYGMDLRIKRGGTPPVPARWSEGRGYMPMKLSQNSVDRTFERIRPNGETFYRTQLSLEEVDLPW